MTILRETDYAIQMLKHLSKHKEKFTSLSVLSKETGVSFLFLQKIARKLRLARILKAGQGVTGGYRLNIPAEKISLKKIIESIEGSSSFMPCLRDKKDFKCLGTEKKCIIQSKLMKVNKQIDDIFKKTKLSDL